MFDYGTFDDLVFDQEQTGQTAPVDESGGGYKRSRYRRIYLEREDEEDELEELALKLKALIGEDAPIAPEALPPLPAVLSELLFRRDVRSAIKDRVSKPIEPTKRDEVARLIERLRLAAEKLDDDEAVELLLI